MAFGCGSSGALVDTVKLRRSRNKNEVNRVFISPDWNKKEQQFRSFCRIGARIRNHRVREGKELGRKGIAKLEASLRLKP